jgi:mannose-6-phosphate isomerase-like protein (cupin superfamily)
MSALFQPFPMLAGRDAQVWHHQPSFRRPRHFHLEPELNVVARGHGVLSVGERQFVVQAGDCSCSR